MPTPEQEEIDDDDETYAWDGLDRMVQRSQHERVNTTPISDQERAVVKQIDFTKCMQKAIETKDCRVQLEHLPDVQYMLEVSKQAAEAQ